MHHSAWDGRPLLANRALLSSCLAYTRGVVIDGDDSLPFQLFGQSPWLLSPAAAQQARNCPQCSKSLARHLRIPPTFEFVEHPSAN
jgi:hypothetical protein